MTRTCTCCTRVMDLQQFREFRSGGRLNKCRQCEAGDSAMRKIAGRLPPRKPDPLNLALRDWIRAA